MSNPFHYGTPATGDQFTGREQELSAVLARARDGIGVALSSPRRFGKTSLLIKADDILMGEGRLVVRVSAMGCADPAAFASRLAGATYRTRTGRWHRLKNALPEFVKRFRVVPKIDLASGTPEFLFSPEMSPRDLETVVSDVYSVLAEASTKKPAVLIIDEFQELPELAPETPGLFKTLMDHRPGVCLIIAGSKRHLIERLVLSPSAPLFGMLQPLDLPAIPAHEMTAFLIGRSKAGGKRLSAEVASTIVEMAEPAPNDIQRLAYEAFIAASDDQITAADLDEAMDTAIGHRANEYEMRLEACTRIQRRALRSLAETPTASIYASGFRETIKAKSTGSVQTTIEALERTGLVVKRGNLYRIDDPFIAEWLRRLSRP